LTWSDLLRRGDEWMEAQSSEFVGFTLLDGAALVGGAAVASVHIRGAVPDELPGGGWVLVWITFAGVALTAGGPFVFLERRFWRRTRGYPRVGDVLWAILGLPWLLTALLRTASPGGGPRRNELVSAGLSFGLGIASMIALAVVWGTWVLVPPEQVSKGSPTPWTNRMGLILAVAWPLQCGFGLVFVGS
jgi:hypothetical protein